MQSDDPRVELAKDSSLDRLARAACGIVLRLVVVAVLVATLSTGPAGAQEDGTGEPVFVSRQGSGYEVYDDGTFVIGGDVVGSCDAVLQETRQTDMKPGREILRQVEICTEAGFPPPGSAALPDTGGPPLLAIATAMIAGGFLCVLGVRRRAGG